MSTKLSSSQYLVALSYLKAQTDALEPAQLVLPVEGLTAMEGDRQNVVRAVDALKVLIADAYANAQRGQ